MKRNLTSTISIIICSFIGSAFAETPAQLTLVKEVVGGEARSTEWVLIADGTDDNDLSGLGLVFGLVNPDTFTLSESAGPPGYIAGDWDCVGGGNLIGQDLTLSADEEVTCTIINRVPPVVIFDSDFALPSMPGGDGSGTPVCVDDASGLLVAGCDSAMSLNGLTCGEGEYLTGFTLEGDLICTFVSKCRPIGCDDYRECTANDCDETIGLCINDPEPFEDQPCDDGDVCTVEDMCNDGACQSSSLLNCDDGNFCTADSCDPETGCISDTQSMEQSPCDDGDGCTIDDECDGTGNCLGFPVDCDDGNACTADVCYSSAGCSNEWEPQGAPCDDGNFCTFDECDGSGQCVGVPRSCDDGNACTDDYCDATAGSCINPVKLDQSSCDSEIPGGLCFDGTCIPGCVPDCTSLECGDDGCGGSCGVCQPGEACNSGTCVPS